MNLSPSDESDPDATAVIDAASNGKVANGVGTDAVVKAAMDAIIKDLRQEKGARFIALAAAENKKPYLASTMFVDQQEEDRISDPCGSDHLGWAGRLKSWATATRDLLFDRMEGLNSILGSTLPLPLDLRKKMRAARAELMKSAGLRFVNLEKWPDGSCGESHPLLSLNM